MDWFFVLVIITLSIIAIIGGIFIYAFIFESTSGKKVLVLYDPNTGEPITSPINTSI